MKIAITGHTKGIGLALAEGFKKQGHKVIGFSRSNGYDIVNPKNVDKIIKKSADCDVFINNAYSGNFTSVMEGFIQTDLLLKLHQLWRGQSKKIVVIGSSLSEVYRSLHPDTEEAKYGLLMYETHKISLEHTVNELRTLSWKSPEIIHLKPGLVDTDMTKHLHFEKMNTNYVFDLCNWAIQQPHQILDLTFTA